MRKLIYKVCLDLFTSKGLTSYRSTGHTLKLLNKETFQGKMNLAISSTHKNTNLVNENFLVYKQPKLVQRRHRRAFHCTILFLGSSPGALNNKSPK